ncbi:hypothetical protein G7077_10245 [Sphingomonas piscis]|uniref:Uncharacterized protein n=1 Tax=Sphingomonas piscis TaxID=2714943 RepID=A0A6G7YR54_9SPHN|nr:hypothetical protein [Sphingomonas piscis]QIK79219.1 hypothetical protein G7077_10245 [Sphingomonas piscis]
MSASSFRGVFMVATCAGAALSCYLVSLRVASERTALEDVETKIVLAQRDIRLLQTEIGTRGRLAQLERWNVKVMALSAPTADQFLKGGFELAKLTTPEHKPAVEAPVLLASAPAPVEEEPAAPQRSVAPAQLLHEASLKTSGPSLATELQKAQPVRKPAPVKVEAKPTVAAKAAPKTTEAKAKPVATATAKPSVKPTAASPKAATPAGKQPRTAARDPLAPLPEKKVKVAAATPKSTKAPAKKQ